jgi:beta-D-xylosidase 4
MKNKYPNPSDAVAAILKAGTDVDCGGFMKQNAQRALTDGTVTEEDFNVILRRQFRLRIRLGMFDPPGALQTIGVDQVCTPAAAELARDGVRQSVVLVKNTGGVLPLNAASFSSALVVGPVATESGIGTTTYYGSTPCPGTAAAPLDAISQHVAGATAITCPPNVGSNDTSGVAAAAAAAANAPLVVLAVGSDLSLEREGHDRLVINISDGQLAMIAAVSAAAKGPVVALVFSGGAMDISPLLANPKISAVLLCLQPSVQVVGAGDVLFGKTLDGRLVAPAGRMSQMTYPANCKFRAPM